MKPVTEDQVQTLLDGLEMREKAALRKLERKTAASKAVGERMTAKIFRLKSTPRITEGGGASEVVDIAAKRRERRERISSKGFFFYSVAPRALEH